MLAVGFDAEEHGVILAWGFALSESTDTWSWFLSHLKESFPTMDQQGNVIVSDRQKVRLYSGKQVSASCDRD